MASPNNYFDGNFILSGIFSNKGYRIHMFLTRECISYEIENVPKSQTVIPLRCLIAANPCDCTGAKSRKPLRCYFCRIKQSHTATSVCRILPSNPKSMRLHFAMPFGRHSWKLETQIFRPLQNTNLCNWLDALNEALLDLNRPRTLLIFINPFGGKKKGTKIYEQTVLPILQLAGILADVVVTQRANHARDMISDLDFTKYDGIVCIGGDGMFSEILNSVLLKAQKDKGIDVNDIYNSLVIPRITLGIIPAGSTNAAVNSITGSSDPLSATLLIVMGDYTGVDVCGVYSSGKLLRFAVTFLSYGYFGDVVRDSEKLRWMGPKRYSITGFKKILCRKLYEGELQLKIEVPISSRSSWEKECCSVNCEICGEASQSSSDSENSSRKVKWVSVKGRFIAVNAAIVSCACIKSPEGISPSQHLGNGYCDVIVVKSCSRLNYLRYLLRTSHHHKNPFDLNFVEVFRVREFSFSPLISDDKTPATGCVGVEEDNWQELNTSVWNCDGEVLTEPSLSARMHCQLVNVFGRGYEDRKSDSFTTQCFNFFRKH